MVGASTLPIVVLTNTARLTELATIGLWMNLTDASIKSSATNSSTAVSMDNAMMLMTRRFTVQMRSTPVPRVTGAIFLLT